MSSWLRTAVFHEIYPNSFLDTDGDGYGNLNGITQKLDYIKSLGCNALWLNPMYDSPFMDGGYDVRDYFKVSPRFGTEEDFDALIATAHAKGMKVILDLVPGHTSEENADFLQSAKPDRNEMTDRFIWTNGEWVFPDGFKAIGGRHDRQGNYVVNFYSVQPALNYGFNRVDDPSWQLSCDSDAARSTREWLKKVMRFWLDRGADGFRVDMADSLVKNDGERNEKPKTSEIWCDIRGMLDRDYPDAVLVSEWCDPQAIKAGFHADFMLDHHGNPYNLLVRGEEEPDVYSYFNKNGKGDAGIIAAKFGEWYNSVKNDGYIALISCNHDTPRLAPFYSEDSLKLIYATLFTLPGVPFVYYGDEIGMKYIKGLNSVEGGYARTGSRTPMQWNTEKNAGFSTGDKTFLPTEIDKTVNVAAQEKDKKSLLNFMREFFAYRKSREMFCSRDLEFVHAKGSEPLVYRRGDLLCAVNPLGVKQNAPVVLPPKTPIEFTVGKGAKIRKEYIELAPMSFVVFNTAK